MALKLTVYDIIKGPVVSDKVYKMSKALNILTVQVHPHANKPQIAQAVERLFNVKVKKVRVIIRKGKTKRARGTRIETKDALKKRAMITLADGYNLDLLTQGGVAPTQAVQERSERAAVE